MFESKKTKLYRKALQVLRSCDPRAFSQMRRCKADNYSPTRDIPLSLVLEKLGIIAEFDGAYSSPHAMDQVLQQFERDYGPSPYRDLEEAILDLDGNEGLYREMQKLEEKALSKIPEDLQTRYQRQIYFLRVNLLDKFLQAASRGEMLRLDPHDTPEGEEIIFAFCQSVVNDYMKENARGYEPIPAQFDVSQFEQYLKLHE